MGMLSVIYGLFTRLWDFIQVKLMRMWLIMWLLENDRCIIPLCMNVKKWKIYTG